MLPTMAGLMEQVCVRARVLLWRWLGVAVCPTITVQYHHSGNFLTAPRICNKSQLANLKLIKMLIYLIIDQFLFLLSFQTFLKA
jgi:hypothetical protein